MEEATRILQERKPTGQSISPTPMLVQHSPSPGSVAGTSQCGLVTVSREIQALLLPPLTGRVCAVAIPWGVEMPILPCSGKY